jgi:transposase
MWQLFPVTYQDVTYADRALIVWSAGKQRLDEEKRKLYRKRLLNRCAEIKAHLNQGRYIRHAYPAHQIALAQRGNPAKGLVSVELTGADRELGLTFQIDRPALARAQTLDGRYLLGTNAEFLSADQALSIFKAQDPVEKSHAQLKGPLRVRPLFLHSDERIEGLVFVTLLALLVSRLLELHARRAGLRISAERMLQTFTSFYATHLTFVDGSQYQQLGKMTPSQEKILDKLLFPSPSRYLEPLPD